MEQIQHFTIGQKVKVRMLWDASAGGTIRTKNEDEVKEFTEKICHNEYCSQSERGVKLKGCTQTRCQYCNVNSTRGNF